MKSFKRALRKQSLLKTKFSVTEIDVVGCRNNRGNLFVNRIKAVRLPLVWKTPLTRHTI